MTEFCDFFHHFLVCGSRWQPNEILSHLQVVIARNNTRFYFFINHLRHPEPTFEVLLVEGWKECTCDLVQLRAIEEKASYSLLPALCRPMVRFGALPGRARQWDTAVARLRRLITNLTARVTVISLLIVAEACSIWSSEVIWHVKNVTKMCEFPRMKNQTNRLWKCRQRSIVPNKRLYNLRGIL